MWQETKHGLYKQFNFTDFRQAFAFMTKVAALAEEQNHHPRWENEWSVVQIWLITHEGKELITDKDRRLAAAIDAILDKSPENDAANSNKVDSAKDVKVAQTIVKRLKIYTDGGSRGNPGPSASGYVLYDESGNVVVDKGVYLGITTNNQAEYTALKLALEDAKKLGASEVMVFMDSLLVVNQMNGIFKIKNRDLWPLHDAIKQLAKGFKKISFNHVPREQNKVADAAVNRALDEQLGLLK